MSPSPSSRATSSSICPSRAVRATYGGTAKSDTSPSSSITISSTLPTCPTTLFPVFGSTHGIMWQFRGSPMYSTAFLTRSLSLTALRNNKASTSATARSPSPKCTSKSETVEDFEGLAAYPSRPAACALVHCADLLPRARTTWPLVPPAVSSKATSAFPVPHHASDASLRRCMT